MSRILQAHRVAAPLSSPEAEGLQVCGDEKRCGKDANYPSRVSPSPFQQERVDLGLGCSSLPIPATPQIPTATEVQLTRPMEDLRSISPLPKAVYLSCTFTASQTIAVTATGSKKFFLLIFLSHQGLPLPCARLLGLLGDQSKTNHHQQYPSFPFIAISSKSIQ